MFFRPKSSIEDGYSDGEEDFYFNEIDLDDECHDSVFPPPLALSPTPTQSHFDMVKSPWSEPGASTSPTYGSLQHPSIQLGRSNDHSALVQHAAGFQGEW